MSEAPSAKDLAKHPLDKLVERYVLIRTQKKEIETEANKRIGRLDDALALLADAMLMILNANGMTSAPTAHGTPYIHPQKTGSIVDFEKFWDFVKSRDHPEMLQRRLTLTAVSDYNDAHPDKPVPGLALETIRTVHVRAK